MTGKPACAAPQYHGVTWWMGQDIVGGGRTKQSVVADMRRARTVCLDCPVMTECLNDNITETLGVWGATLPAERAAIRLERGIE